jgi:hypothetical protein
MTYVDTIAASLAVCICALLARDVLVKWIESKKVKTIADIEKVVVKHEQELRELKAAATLRNVGRR